MFLFFIEAIHPNENNEYLEDNYSVEENSSASSSEESISYDFTYTGKAENLLMSSSLFYLHYEKMLGWRGMFDYYLTDAFSFAGVSHFPFENINSMRLNYLGLGLNLHILKFTDIEFYLGGTAGFLWIINNQSMNTITEALEFNAGLIYFCSIFFLKIEVTYRMADASLTNNTGADVYHKLHQSFASLGIGFKL